MSQKVTQLLKQIQADSLVFYTKLHNLHWHIEGPMFKPIHEATEKIYDEFADVFDDAAERIIQLGDKPYVTLVDILKNAKIKEESATAFQPVQVLKIILDDFEYFMKLFKELSDVADDAKDKVSADYANGILAVLEKEIWMLKTQLK
ncbi:DNA starvation/stationary phase protection protein [Helicobacter sp. MIT 99-5507]|uniref:Dps family protein n=1 Tax=Helicobacter sp. MIT 99-5507 TaxID=152489 RepID=UPI000E1E66DB|nr:DNA starvation/stationary phase protection protein [Helicobacter sp. MIT 99-5507]RDU58591.1 DNA starvation/stationary phase protection protein [Helicobacter sp. MIT 99-5507]